MMNRKLLQRILIGVLRTALSPHGWAVKEQVEGKTLSENPFKLCVVDFGNTDISLRASDNSPEQYARAGAVSDAVHSFSVALYSARRDEIEEVIPDAVEAIYSAGEGEARRFMITEITGGAADVEQSQARNSVISVSWAETIDRRGKGL